MSARKSPALATARAIIGSPYFWALAIRVAILFFRPANIRGDASDFQKIAQNLAEGHGFSRCDHEPFPLTAERPPLYPMILSFFFASGLSIYIGPALLNGIMDFFSMRMARGWASASGFRNPRFGEWLIALCVPLLSYGRYATTENMSVFLFMAAMLAIHRKRWALAGLSFGLLSLCRTYLILFPPLLILGRALLKMSWRSWAIMLVMSFIPASLWMARNQIQLGVPEFSQGANFAFQAYPGLCRTNFDWWNSVDVAFVFNHPVFGKLTRAHCLKEDELLAIDREGRPLVWQCIQERPGFVLNNIARKALNLYIGWGQFLPYTYVPGPYRNVIDSLMAILWVLSLFLIARRWKSSGSKFRAAFFPFGLATIYVGLVTIPFAIDSRYMLAPFIGVLICAADEAGSLRSLRKLFQPLGK